MYERVTPLCSFCRNRITVPKIVAENIGLQVKQICYGFEQKLLLLTETHNILQSFSVKFLLENPAITVSMTEICTITNFCFCPITVMVISALTETELSERN